jgi:UDPglucose 6-dehydrogenase
MQATVLGAGYVGLVTAAHLAGRGVDVAVYDPDALRIGQLLAGVVPIHEPGLSESLAAAQAAGRFRAFRSPEPALARATLVFVCVGTPLSPAGEADTRQVESACELLVAHRDAQVIVRSTLPLGESAKLAGWLGRARMDHVATNPEFLRQGSAMVDVRRPTRIVIGTADGRPNVASGTLERLSSHMSAPVLITDFVTAETIKNAANAFLASKLSFVNEIADLCEAYGADVDAVMHGIGLDPRIGTAYLRPGIGFGGSCLPKELANLGRLGRARGLPMRMLRAAGDANDERPSSIVCRLEEVLGPLAGRSVAILGMTFKPDTDDVRYSPALALARAFLSVGARVRAHDPAAVCGPRDAVSGLDRVPSAESAIALADLVVLATDWPEYALLDWEMLAARARSAVVYDGRRMLDADRLRAAGWRVMRVGEAFAQAEALAGELAGVS